MGYPSEEIYDMIEYIKNSSRKWRAGHTSNKMNLPKTEDEMEKMGYVLGALAGDGHIPKVVLFKNDKEIQNVYQEDLSDEKPHLFSST